VKAPSREAGQKFVGEAPRALARTPKIVSRQIEGDGWDGMREMAIAEVDE
jgi:hypothetical protein